MSSHERRFRDHNPEKIPFLVKQAVKLVPVGDFLKIRYGQENIGEEEIHVLLDGGNALNINLVDEGEISPSKDLRVKWARGLLEKVPFHQYLTAKRAVIVQEIEKNATNEFLFSSLVGFEEERSRIEEKRQKLAAEFESINKVIWEIGGLPK